MSAKKVVPDRRFFPRDIFRKRWLDKQFVPPKNAGRRAALRLEFETYVGYGIMDIPGFERVKKVLLERLKLLEPPPPPLPRKGIDMEVPPYLLEAAWVDANRTLHANPKIREEIRSNLEKYPNASALYNLRSLRARIALMAYIAALDVYDEKLRTLTGREWF